MCSSFKYLLASYVMTRAQAGHERLDQMVAIPASALLPYAPVTTPASKEGRPLSVEALCEAATKVSDNTAANLLLARSGGPAALTRWLRAFDRVTRLDRNEPTLNESKPGDPRDTTSPAAIARDLDTLLFGPTLNARHKALLLRWMSECETGLHKLRAGIPAGWSAADKTGNNGRDTSGDVALLTTPKGGRIFVACYVTESKLRGPEQEAIFAEVGRIVSAAAHG